MDNTALHTICHDIDACFRSPDKDILKNDRSSTVVKLALDNQRPVVIRRDNFKSVWTYLKRAIRNSRSRKVWNNGRSMGELGLKTIAPMALVEDYRFFVRTASYVVCAYIDGMPFGKYFSNPQRPGADKAATARKLVQAMDRWHALGVTHGDPKASNILIGQDDIHFIDAEDIKTPKSKRSKKRAITRDKYIILHNWQKFPAQRDEWTRKFVLEDNFGKHYFGKRLVKKYWKDEYSILSKSFSRIADSDRLLEQAATTKSIYRWFNRLPSVDAPTGLPKNSSFYCIVSERSFFLARNIKSYFSKKRVPTKGIFSMAVALRSCGFLLPDIIDGGIFRGFEYAVFDRGSGQSVYSVWKDLEKDHSRHNNFIVQLAEEIGRLHALGFLGVIQSMDSIFVRPHNSSTCIGFGLNRNVRYHPGRKNGCLKAEVNVVKSEFLSRTPDHVSDLFWGKYYEVLGE